MLLLLTGWLGIQLSGCPEIVVVGASCQGMVRGGLAPAFWAWASERRGRRGMGSLCLSHVPQCAGMSCL